MHPDLKVGLALTLLIVGFAAAMCFRHRPAEPAALSDELARDADLDAQMDLLPVRTYEAETSGSDEGSDAPVIDAESADLISFTDGDVEIPQPIASTEDADGSANASGGSETGSSTAPSEVQTYRVKSGDTLSGIAATFLGSTQRYEEIFDANRHLLNSPDDLRPGMELVIPPRDRTETSAETGSVNLPTDTPSEGQNSEPLPAAAQRFTPIIPR